MDAVGIRLTRGWPFGNKAGRLSWQLSARRANLSDWAGADLSCGKLGSISSSFPGTLYEVGYEPKTERMIYVMYKIRPTGVLGP
jgi:hypothetical protein